MNILFISGREPGYVRNAMILKGLKRNGVEILDCTDSSAFYPTRYVIVSSKFILGRKKAFDSVFVGFFGQPIVPLIRLLTSKPILFDAFLSAYDTMCFDRKRFRPDSMAGKFFYWLDKRSCQDSDRILLDTNTHIDYFINTFGLPREKFHRVLVGADETIFYPRTTGRVDRQFRVFYYTSYLPLHGTEYIIQAAKLLERHGEIEFEIVGNGPHYHNIRKLARSTGVNNIRFADWIPYEGLPLKIARADVCLGGHFSDIEKAKRVIAGKTFQFIAMKKPVIVGECAGNRELFTDRQNALFVKMADAGALADAILELRDNEILREQIAAKGYETFIEKCTTDAVGRELAGIIRGLG
jgi:glycosyltransferase involved in cell wall biosynthesis